MATDCPTEPSVNNGVVTLSNDSETITATYQCLTGFVLTGDQRIDCNLTVGVWPSAPNCSVIPQDTYVYLYNTLSSSDEPWYILAGILGFFILLLLAAVIWCCCCMTCGQTTPVYPYQDSERGSALGGRRQRCAWCFPFRRYDPDMFNSRNSVFWIHNKNSECSSGPPSHRTAGMTSAETSNREVQLYRKIRPAKDPRESKSAWMPHSNAVRQINTSTK